MITTIQTDKAAPAVGPYSQAIIVGNFIFCSGQIGVLTNGTLVEGIEAQTRQALINLTVILGEAGVKFDHVIKTTIYLKNITDFEKVNKIYGDFMGFHRPARSTVEVSNLPKGALIEVEAIATVASAQVT